MTTNIDNKIVRGALWQQNALKFVSISSGLIHIYMHAAKHEPQINWL